MAVRKLVIHLRASLWFIPVLCVLAGAALSAATIFVDRSLDYEGIPESMAVGPDAATAILSTVAASMVSLTALVLTITMVVVQLAMGQFSPRIVQRILRDKPSQFAIGLFVATFVHAILALSEVANNGDGTGQVPGIAIVTAFVLVLVSIAVLVLYVQHIGQALRVSALIELVGEDTRKLVDRVYSETGEEIAREPGALAVIAAEQSGVITLIHTDRLVESARAGPAAPSRWCPRWVSSSRPAPRCSESTANRRNSTKPTCTVRSSSVSSARSTRTSPTACGCSSTSPSARCRTHRFRIPRRPCRRSIACTTSCVSSFAVRSPTAAITTSRASSV